MLIDHGSMCMCVHAPVYACVHVCWSVSLPLYSLRHCSCLFFLKRGLSLKQDLTIIIQPRLASDFWDPPALVPRILGLELCVTTPAISSIYGIIQNVSFHTTWNHNSICCAPTNHTSTLLSQTRMVYWMCSPSLSIRVIAQNSGAGAMTSNIFYVSL